MEVTTNINRIFGGRIFACRQEVGGSMKNVRDVGCEDVN
jgi:hypothetical protein